MAVNMGTPAGRESYGVGPPVVGRARNKPCTWRSGNPRRRARACPLIKVRRGGIAKFTHVEACAMQTTNTYLELLHERGKKGLPLKRVYRQLFNKHLYLTAYGRIYRNAGAMTPGVTHETVDAISLYKIDSIIELLRTERYQCKSDARTYIPKKHGRKRPFGLPVWS